MAAPASVDFTGCRVRWLGDSIWSRAREDQPLVEIPRGSEGTVAEFVGTNEFGEAYRMAFDNGAQFATFLPAPWAIEVVDRPPSP